MEIRKNFNRYFRKGFCYCIRVFIKLLVLKDFNSRLDGNLLIGILILGFLRIS